MATHRLDEAERLREMGPDLVLLPFHDAANRAVGLIVTGESRPLPQPEEDHEREAAE